MGGCDLHTFFMIVFTTFFYLITNFVSLSLFGFFCLDRVLCQYNMTLVFHPMF